jgi:hypothetical protein
MSDNFENKQIQDDDGFRLVISKRKTKQKDNFNYKIGSNFALNTNKFVNTDHINDNYVNDLYKKIVKLKSELLDHDSSLYVQKFMFNLKKNIQNHFKTTESNRFVEIICYGVGSMDDSMTSRHQLSLILAIIYQIMQSGLIDKINYVEFYDPVFNKADEILIESKLGYKISSKNEKCMRTVNDCLTLFYMPHCPKALYNNLLYANWSKKCLKNLILFGNSFTTIHSMTDDAHMKRKYSYLNDSFKLVNEIRLDYKCDITNSFYDLNLHVFKGFDKDFDEFSNKLEDELDLNRLQEPIYESNEEII